LRKIPIVEDIQSDLLVTTYFQDLGSPKGPTGMIDWRLNGFISRNIVEKRITGAKGEITLVPLNKKFSTQRMLLLGLGKWLMDIIINYPALKDVDAWMLATKDAHTLYAKYGFKPLENPGIYMKLNRS